MAFEDNDSDEYLWSERPRRLEHRFLVLRKLGQGTYGKVQLALNKETNQEVAIKTIKKAKIENDEDMLRIRREIHIMTSIRHPHIIHIYEVFETKQKIVLVMQYASGGELYDYLGCHEKLPEDEARRVFRQISSAIYYCHKNKICHRDLKLENILLDQEGNAQIADFGLSNIFDENRRMSTFCGSALYASPEIVKGMPYKGPEVDCWSLGVLLYTLIYGTMPFDGRNFKELVSQISEGRYEEPVNKSDASNLIRRLLTPEISLRATILDVCKDNWVNKDYDVSLLQAAENMCSSKNFQKEHLLPTKLCQETNKKINCDRTVNKKSTPETKQPKIIPLKNCNNIGSSSENCNNDVKNLHLPALHDQIINYDVRFVVNKLIAAVEILTNKIPTGKNDFKQSTLSNNKHIFSNDSKPKNGEKVNSEYVIPIFEVTSIVPTMKERIKRDAKQKIYSLNGFVKPRDLNKTDSVQHHPKQEESQVLREPPLEDETEILDDREPKQLMKATDVLSEPTVSIEEHLEDHQKKVLNNSKLTRCSNNSIGNVNVEDQANFIQLREPDVSVSHKPSPKLKRRCDNYSHGQKNMGPFVRTKNHVLTLARILSSNYEQLVMNSFKKPDKKRKLPGKVTIPANFDSNLSRESVAVEREKIVLFPTVSVSENREKIERKIEKIKKAALNMQLKWQYNPKNRLKIEKYLRSQAKKMQDLVCDEQRYLRLSRNNVKRHASFTSFSDICCCFVAKTMNNFITDNHNVSEFCQISTEQAQESEFVGNNKMKSTAKTDFILTDIQNVHSNKSKKCQHCYSKTIPTAYLGLGNLLRSKSEIKLSGDFLKHVSFHNDDLIFKRQFLDSKLNYNCDSEKANNLTDTYMNSANVKSMMLHRSASDSVILQVHKTITLNNNAKNLSDPYHTESKLQKIFKRDFTHLQNHAGENSIKYDEKSHKHRSLSLSENAQLADRKLEAEVKNINQYDVFKNASIFCSRSTSNIVNFGERTCNEWKHYINYLSSTPLINFKENKGIKSLLENNHADDITASCSALTQNQAHDIASHKGIQRRNILGGTMSNTDPLLNDYDIENEGLERILWNFYKEQEMLLSREQNEGQFSSSPNLNHSSKEIRRNEDSKSMINLHSEVNMCEKYSIRNFERQLASSAQTLNDIYSPRLKKELNFLGHTPVNDLSGKLNHIKSMSDGVLTEEEQNEILRNFFVENEASHLHFSDPCNNKTALYFSTLLTDLEKKEQLHRTKDSTKSRRYPRRISSLEKRKKSEHGGKSFLHLLSLKRIEEAEKELERSQKAIVDEIEENPGSLLEALKTYGYKNVISQRFQDAELDSEDKYNMKYPYWLSAKNLKADIPHFQYRYYNASYPHCDTNCLEYDDIDGIENIYFGSTPTINENQHSFHGGMLPNINNQYTISSGKATNSYEFHYNFNGGSVPNFYDCQYDLNESTSPSFYKTEASIKQKESKQSFYDWLTANFDEYQSSPKLNHSVSTPEESIYRDEISKPYSSLKTERSRSFEDEHLPDFSNRNQKMFLNNFENYETEKNRTLTSDYSEYRKPCTVDKCRLTPASSIDEDEREESVQDRIWRKSFYSRFNNSALSRKEKTNFLELDFSSESRAELSNHSYTSPKSKNCEKNGFLNSYDLSKAAHVKRSLTTKKYDLSSDKLNNLKCKYSRSSFKDKAGVNAINISSNKLKNNISKK